MNENANEYIMNLFGFLLKLSCNTNSQNPFNTLLAVWLCTYALWKLQH